jgi:hypothetical protein
MPKSPGFDVTPIICVDALREPSATVAGLKNVCDHASSSESRLLAIGVAVRRDSRSRRRMIVFESSLNARRRPRRISSLSFWRPSGYSCVARRRSKNSDRRGFQSCPKVATGATFRALGVFVKNEAIGKRSVFRVPRNYNGREARNSLTISSLPLGRIRESSFRDMSTIFRADSGVSPFSISCW